MAIEPYVETENNTVRGSPWKIWAGVAGLVVIALVAWVLLGGKGKGSGAAPGVSRPGISTTTRTTLAPGDFVTYRDDQAGFTIKRPKGWAQLEPTDPTETRLVLSTGSAGDSVLVRVRVLEHPIDTTNLDDLKAFTNGIFDEAVRGSTDVKVLQRATPITVNGMIGYVYVYTFRDGASGLQGAHTHYFLYQGRKMNTIVFQALPAEHFSRLADTFDTIAESFRSDPDVLPAVTSPTTAPAP